MRTEIGGSKIMHHVDYQLCQLGVSMFAGIQIVILWLHRSQYDIVHNGIGNDVASRRTVAGGSQKQLRRLSAAGPLERFGADAAAIYRRVACHLPSLPALSFRALLACHRISDYRPFCATSYLVASIRHPLRIPHVTHCVVAIRQRWRESNFRPSRS